MARLMLYLASWLSVVEGFDDFDGLLRSEDPRRGATTMLSGPDSNTFCFKVVDQLMGDRGAHGQQVGGREVGQRLAAELDRDLSPAKDSEQTGQLSLGTCECNQRGHDEGVAGSGLRECL